MHIRRMSLMTFACLLVPAVCRADYAGTVLYPIDLPSGYSSGLILYDVAGGQTVGGVNYSTPSNPKFRAMLWDGSATPTDLTPAGYTNAVARGTDGTHQVGYANGGASGTHALLWSGTAASVVDLSLTGGTSIAYGVGGGQQVGIFGTHAELWAGTAASAVNLQPTNLSGFGNTVAYAADGHQQVGYGYPSTTSSVSHALLWSGTAGSAIDLQPTNLAGIGQSEADGVGGGRQVGRMSLSGTDAGNHAVLWSGTADSAIDLHPTNLAGITGSGAVATNGTLQVGTGAGPGTSNQPHALLWSGTADSAIDLQLLLPSDGSWIASQAFSVDAAGDVFGVAYGTEDGTTSAFAVEWAAAPEPTSLLLLAAAVAPLAVGRRRRLALPLSSRNRAYAVRNAVASPSST